MGYIQLHDMYSNSMKYQKKQMCLQTVREIWQLIIMKNDDVNCYGYNFSMWKFRKEFLKQVQFRIENCKIYDIRYQIYTKNCEYSNEITINKAWYLILVNVW